MKCSTSRIGSRPLLTVQVPEAESHSFESEIKVSYFYCEESRKKQL